MFEFLVDEQVIMLVLIDYESAATNNGGFCRMKKNLVTNMLTAPVLWSCGNSETCSVFGLVYGYV
jgi:hypothetical protein